MNNKITVYFIRNTYLNLKNIGTTDVPHIEMIWQRFITRTQLTFDEVATSHEAEERRVLKSNDLSTINYFNASVW